MGFYSCKIDAGTNVYILGKELAEQSEILETVGDQDPAQFYYGQGQ